MRPQAEEFIPSEQLQKANTEDQEQVGNQMKEEKKLETEMEKVKVKQQEERAKQQEEEKRQRIGQLKQEARPPSRVNQM